MRSTFCCVKTKLLIVSLLIPLAPATAQAPLMPYQEHEKRLKAAGQVERLKSDLFGDSVSLYNGSTEFSVVDIDLPGNNSLPVRLTRRFRVESSKDPRDTKAKWFFDAPYLTTYNWFVQSNSQTPNRCTNRWLPYVATGFKLEDIWHGVQLHIPSQTDEDLKWVAANLSEPSPYPAPSSNGPYYWGTRSHFRFSCLPNTANGYHGQAFLGVDPQGSRYFFDVGYDVGVDPIYKRVSMTFDQLTPHPRSRSYLLLRRVEDRFGNWVNYSWSGNRLQGIIASDGRSISLTHSGDNATATVSDSSGTRIWRYEGVTGVHGLSRVVLPDNSTWEYSYAGSTGPLYPLDDANNSGDFRCIEPLEATSAFSITMRHPSGALGEFSFELLRHRRAGLPPSVCQWVYNYQGRDVYEMAIPEFFDVYSIQQKRITGPGIQPQTWSYAYEIIMNGRTGSVVHGGSCDGSKDVVVHQPDGSSVSYRFGVVHGCNDGRLLETSIRNVAGKTVKTVWNRYATRAEASQMPFPEFAGGIPQVGDEPTANWELPLLSTVTRVGKDIATSPSDAFVTRYEAFDQYARPTRIIRAGVGASGAAAAPPATPPALSLSPSAGYTGDLYTLSWATVYGATRYELLENGAVIHNSGATSNTLSGGSPGTYSYRVRACNDVGCSALSREQLRTTYNNAPPPPPPNCNPQTGVCEQEW